MATHVLTEWPAGVDVLAVDLDLRERPAEEAFSATATAVRALGRERRIFLKIDSTLRGPVAALVNGALEASGAEKAIVAPAFPEQGRIVRDGRVHVNGQPGSSLVDVLGPDRSRTVVVDAIDASALRAVAEAWPTHPEWLLVGSAGLARHVAPPPQHVPIDVDQTGPVLVVAGSPALATHAQLAPLPAMSELVVFNTEPAAERDEGQTAHVLADRVAAWSAEHRPRAVVLTGGATARAVCHRLGASHLRILGELQPGVPIGRFEDGAWRGVGVVTKAGGFGTPETLLDVVRALGVSSTQQASHD